MPPQRCPVCAEPAPGGLPCGACIAAPPAFDATVAALRYEYPATRLIQAFKYAPVVGLASPLAELLAEAVAADGPERPDILVAMPLSRERLAERGFNQALELARIAGRRIGVPLAARAVARVRHGPAQAGLPLAERARNVRGAFVATRRFDGLDVAVVDDVMTSGASLDALARALRAAGARRVRNWVLARACDPA
ncbi:MAG: ComF family protein [Burkholderiales bacterium]|nr:ComF family protein [Burkholderiales bacterium]